jgi:dTDP-4-amino-4,6-dideoxygalactose transaminase
VHGKGADKYDNIRIGMNSRLDTIQAAVLLEKLTVFPEELDLRNRIANLYSEHYKSLYSVPILPEGYLSSWAQYTLVSSTRDVDMKKFLANNIPTEAYYKTCMHQQTAFQELDYTDADFPVASELAKTVFSLPMSPYIKDSDINLIIKHSESIKDSE